MLFIYPLKSGDIVRGDFKIQFWNHPSGFLHVIKEKCRLERMTTQRAWNIYVVLSENSVPLHPMINDHYPVFKWLFHWEYTWIYPTFSDKPMWFCQWFFLSVHNCMCVLWLREAAGQLEELLWKMPCPIGQGLLNVPWLGYIGHHLIVAIIDHIPNGI